MIIAVAGGRSTVRRSTWARRRRPCRGPRAPARVAQLLGAQVPSGRDRGAAALGRLRRSTRDGDGGVLRGHRAVVAPRRRRRDRPHRGDRAPARLRLVSDELRPFRPGTVPDHPLDRARPRVREALVATGLLEARPMPFTSGADAGYVARAQSAGRGRAVPARDAARHAGRRAEDNLARMQGDVRLFEIGIGVRADRRALPREEMRVGVLVMGRRRPAHFTRAASPPAIDEWDAKALAEQCAARRSARARR